ncbi:nicotinate-nucleotide adenylyltransferase [Iningainema tapete]|uniref:Probable nicotinate-nucleotide adenylyltransferase n=1 Tax=Iningainema tapete BLCC-T55 TaxID=2748662 RepID=A0A8J6XPD2_9CYAN|nr:nicotinate-nucleotide adenylyltransferase [Iningainema tapete]MBD2776816.1 nicotinate-nucleotide adenylyltransferase [Iningainema tapete BLCC-T55]
MRVALFGTSADPPTAGHLAIVGWLSERYDWVAVWAADNPLKSHQALLEHRVAMLRLLMGDVDLVGRGNVGLDQELSAMRTLETVGKARDRWGKDADFTLVVGSDLLAQLPRWYKVEDLLLSVQLLVMPRPGYGIDELSLEQVRRLGGKVAIANFIGPDVSSTAYREHHDLQALTPPVVDYIEREHLYKCFSNSTF